MEALSATRGGEVGLKDVFDRTHQRKGPSGPIYVNKKAQEVGESFDRCREQPEAEGMSYMALWAENVGGPMRGRIFGLGGRSVNLVDPAITSRASKAGPTKSTTSATAKERVYTVDEVEIFAERLAERLAERMVAELLAKQEEQHRAEMDEAQQRSAERDTQNAFFIKELFDKIGLQQPDSLVPPVEPSKVYRAYLNEKSNFCFKLCLFALLCFIT